MCGICGFTGGGTGAEDRATLKAMCDVMAHRGPDGEGFYVADGIALGHRRLSLVDLAGGGQPMVRSAASLGRAADAPQTCAAPAPQTCAASGPRTGAAGSSAA